MHQKEPLTNVFNEFKLALESRNIPHEHHSDEDDEDDPFETIVQELIDDIQSKLRTWSLVQPHTQQLISLHLYLSMSYNEQSRCVFSSVQ
jgi:hypothetical protein